MVFPSAWRWPWEPHLPVPPAAKGIGAAGEAVVHTAYNLGFKDGFLLAVAIFSILLVLFRQRE
jgi:hypothetical protein